MNARECGELVFSIIGEVNLPELTRESSIAVNEAIYALNEGLGWNLEFSTVLDCWRLVQSALAGDLSRRVDEFRL